MSALAPAVRNDLLAVRYHWSAAYRVDVTAHGRREAWTASRRDGQGSVTASSAAGLRLRIHADHAARPVPLEARAS